MKSNFISLRTKLVQQLVPLLVLIIVSVFGCSTYYGYQQNQTELELRLQHLLTNGAIALSHPLMTYNDYEVQKALAMLTLSPELLYAEVLDNDNKSLATIGRRSAQGLNREQPIVFIQDEQGRTLLPQLPSQAAANPTNGQIVGRLKVQFNTNSLQQALLANLALALTLAILSAAAIAWSVSVIFRRSTGMPLQEIVSHIELAIQGDEQRLPISGNDELSLLARAYNQLLDKQAKTVTELQNSRLAAENALAVKGNFLANMSHELRTPLHAIKGFGSLLKDPNELAQQAYYLNKLDNSCDNLLRLIDNILDFSRLEKGLYELSIKSFSLAQVLGRLFELFTTQAQQQQLGLHYQVDPAIPDRLIGDPGIIENSLLSLLSNAFKFTQEGHIQLRIEPLSHQDNRIRLRFNLLDTGPGVEHLSDIELFTPFQQLSQVGRHHDGLGLGLSIASQLLRLAGGILQVDRQYQQGARFYFELDLQIDTGLLHQNCPPNALVLSRDSILALDIRRWFTYYDASLELLQDADVLLRHLRDKHHHHQPLDWVVLDLRDQSLTDLQLSLSAALNKGYLESSQLLLLGSLDGLSLAAEYQAQWRQLDWPINWYELLLGWFQPYNQENRLLALPRGLGGQRHRLLLVEDNTNNQELALELLKPLQLDIELARNGQEAVDRVRQQAFDLILMDLQMPVMGGEEATSRIRQLPQGAYVPIIALTANALKGVREGCFACGMNDFLTKPIQQKQLLATCMRWLNIPLEPQTTAEPLNLPWLAAAHAFQLDIETALERLGGDERLYRQLLKRFLNRYRDLDNQIEQYLALNDRVGLKRLGHSLKGLVASLGAQPLYLLCVELEHQAEQLASNSELQQQLLAKIQHLAEFSQVVGWSQSSTETLETAPQLNAEALCTLAQLLENNDFAAKEVYGQLRHQLSDSDWQQIGQALEAFDFDRASALLAQVQQRLQLA